MYNIFAYICVVIKTKLKLNVMKSSIALRVALGECDNQFAFTAPGFVVYDDSTVLPDFRLLPIWLCPLSYEDYSALLFSALPLPRFLCAAIHGIDSGSRHNIVSSIINSRFSVFVDYDNSIVEFSALDYEFLVPFSSLVDVVKHPLCIFDFLCSGENYCKGCE